MIKFACPGCAAVFTVGDEKAGKTGKCPKCEAQFVIPDAEPSASSPPPPPPPPAATPSEVEIKPCPGCQAKLTVSTEDLGLDVECPYCKKVYKATKPGGSAPNVVVDDRPKRRSRRDEDDDDDRPRKRSRRDADEDEYEDRPRSRKRSRRKSERSGAVTAVMVFNYILGGLGLLCSCITFGAAGFIREVFSRDQRGNAPPIDPGTIQTLLERSENMRFSVPGTSYR